MPEMTPSRLLRYFTVQITTAPSPGASWAGSGTGFHFGFQKGDDQWAPLIITNKHVVDGAGVIGLRLHKKGSNGEALAGPGEEVRFSTSELPIIRHPDPSVDLAGIVAAPIIKMVEEQLGWQPYIFGVGADTIPTVDQWSEFGTLEDVIMAGYPTGLADNHNNLPIVRRGITATPAGADYQGKREFLIDMAVFPGSSGSPVVILNEGSFPTPDGIAIGTRFHLLGVLYGGHFQISTGEVVTAPAPTNVRSVAQVNQMIHLGICVKSTRIAELEQHIPGW
jgi:hypothetical protein